MVTRQKCLLDVVTAEVRTGSHVSAEQAHRTALPRLVGDLCGCKCSVSYPRSSLVALSDLQKLDGRNEKGKNNIRVMGRMMKAAAGVEFKCCCSAHIVPHSAFTGLMLKLLVKKRRSFFACVLYGDLKVLSKMHKIQAIYKMPKKVHLSTLI